MSKRTDILQIAKQWVGIKEGTAEHAAILATYNNHKPLARGYAIKSTDKWCCCTISALSILAGTAGILPTEVGCEEHKKLIKALGYYTKDTTKVRPGDIVYYSWDGNEVANHIGIIEEVDTKLNRITTIEGNKNDSVARRTISLSSPYLNGFGLIPYENLDGDYKQLGWNKDGDKWWYATGYKKGQYLKDGFYKLHWSKGDDWFYFDTNGYLVINKLITITPDGVVKI